MPNNPSSVQDPITGSNYGGIRQDSLGVGAAQKEYLNNLLDTTRRPVGGPLTQQQYTPSGGRSPVIGQISSQTLGSLPIFGSGATIFPQAILDNFSRAQKEAELNYLNELGDVSMDEFQLSSTLKNPWHNQAFSAKYQESLDAWLHASAANFGGDYMKGQKALQGNRDHARMMQSYNDYANIYNSVFDSAVGILSADPEETYVSDTTRKAAQRFIHDYEQLDELPIDELVNRARKFKTHVSVSKVADIAMAGTGERITEGYKEAAKMGTDELKVYIKTTEKGATEADVRELYNLQLEAYPWIKDDPTASKILWAEMSKRADKVFQQSIEKIKKDTANQSSYLKKNGINVDKDGRVQTVDKMPTAFAQFKSSRFQTGSDGIQYPPRDQDGKPVEIATTSGTRSYIIDPSTGNLYYATLPGTYMMTPEKEYTLTGDDESTFGRFVEGSITFEDVGLYSREFTKSPTIGGEVQPSVATGGRTTQTAEKRPVIVRDINTGNKVELYGTYQVITHFDNVKDELNTAYPFLQRTHADLKDTAQKGMIPAPRPQESGKVQGDSGTPGAKSYDTGDEAFADKDSWVKGDVITVEGVAYTWNGNKLKK